MADHTTLLALWSIQGQRRCQYCGVKVFNDPGFGDSLQHIDSDPRVDAHMAVDHV